MPIEFLPIIEWRQIESISGARPSDRFCAARINGDSLIEDGICDRDYVIVRLTFDDHEVTPDALVAVLTPFGMIVKRIYLMPGDIVRLSSSNPAYKDLYFDLEDVIAQGIVVGIDPNIPNKRSRDKSLEL